MEDSGTLVLSLPRIPNPHRIGTYHGGLWDFGSELMKNNPHRIGNSHGGPRDFSSELTKNNSPPPPQLEFLMEASGTLVLSLTTILLTHRIGISHGGLRDFGSELAKNTPTPQNWNFSWRTQDFGFKLTKNTSNHSPYLKLLIEDCAGD